MARDKDDLWRDFPRTAIEFERRFATEEAAGVPGCVLPGRCADEVAPWHAVQRNREHHFDPPVPTQTCGDPCDRPRREPRREP